MMVNPKIISISGCIGFGMSLLIGLISGVTFSSVVLRALIFAVILAVLSILIGIVYAKFLSDTYKSNNAVEAEPGETKVTTGGVVNIVVDDSNLSDDERGPKFSVSASTKNSVESLKDSDNTETSSVSSAQAPAAENIADSQDVNSVKEASDSFKPAGLSTITSGSSDSSAAAPENSQNDGAAAASAAATPEEALDILPEIGGFELDVKNNAGSGVIGDSDFASPGSSYDSDNSSGKDTNTMAMAIRTLLAKDND